jgi:hypothetical protein
MPLVFEMVQTNGTTLIFQKGKVAVRQEIVSIIKVTEVKQAIFKPL